MNRSRDFDPSEKFEPNYWQDGDTTLNDNSFMSSPTNLEKREGIFASRLRYINWKKDKDYRNLNTSCKKRETTIQMNNPQKKHFNNNYHPEESSILNLKNQIISVDSDDDIKKTSGDPIISSINESHNLIEKSIIGSENSNENENSMKEMNELKRKNSDQDLVDLNLSHKGLSSIINHCDVSIENSIAKKIELNSTDEKLKDNSTVATNSNKTACDGENLVKDLADAESLVFLPSQESVTNQDNDESESENDSDDSDDSEYVNEGHSKYARWTSQEIELVQRLISANCSQSSSVMPELIRMNLSKAGFPRNLAAIRFKIHQLNKGQNQPDSICWSKYEESIVSVCKHNAINTFFKKLSDEKFYRTIEECHQKFDTHDFIRRSSRCNAWSMREESLLDVCKHDAVIKLNESLSSAGYIRSMEECENKLDINSSRQQEYEIKSRNFDNCRKRWTEEEDEVIRLIKSDSSKEKPKKIQLELRSRGYERTISSIVQRLSHKSNL